VLAQGIWSVFTKKKGLSKKAGPPVHDDLVGRDFGAERPNALWLTEITEHRTNEGKASFTAAPSRTSTPTASSATASLIG
jgi:hypothetical protein